MSPTIVVYYRGDVMMWMLLLACNLGLEPLWQGPDGEPGKPEFEDSSDTANPDLNVAYGPSNSGPFPEE